MPKNGLSNITYVTITVIYFYVCGGIYLIGYWDTFGVDISNFVSLTDIPKNFVYPFIITTSFLVLYFFIRLEIVQDRGSKKIILEKARKDLNDQFKPYIPLKKWVKIVKYFLSVEGLIALLFVFIYIFYNKLKYSFDFWVYFLAFTFILIMVKVLTSRWFISGRSGINSSIMFFMWLLPFSCLLTAKYQSLKIYKNEEIRILKKISHNKIQPIQDNITLKFIGFLGDKAIVATLDNKKMIILNQDAFEGVEIGEVIKKVKKEKKDETKTTGGWPPYFLRKALSDSL